MFHSHQDDLPVIFQDYLPTGFQSTLTFLDHSLTSTHAELLTSEARATTPTPAPVPTEHL